MRGIGGIFIDYLRPLDAADADRLFAFQQANGNCFVEAYLPIVEKRKNTPGMTPINTGRRYGVAGT